MDAMLLITKSPVRITYAGGNSDYAEFFRHHSGCVVNATIDKYVYFFSLPQWPLAEDRFRFTYRRTESVEQIDDFEHPVIKHLLTKLDWTTPINLGTMADVPGQSGLGASSAFAASAIQNLSARRGMSLSTRGLLESTINLERIELGEPGGWQDQCATVFGGFRTYFFSEDGIREETHKLDQEQQTFLTERQLLLSLNISRSDQSSASQIRRSIASNSVDIGKLCLKAGYDLHESLIKSRTPADVYFSLAESVYNYWQIKKRLYPADDFTRNLQKIEFKLFEIGVDAIKLLGSGSGGYLLIMGKPHILKEVREFFGDKFILDFQYSHLGTHTRTLTESLGV